MTRSRRAIPLRIVVLAPPADIMFCLQRGHDELAQATRSSGADIAFDFTVDVGERSGGLINFLGPFVQGPPAGRFVYVNSGTSAGQTNSCWTRRAKIPLAGISREHVEQVLESPDLLLEVQVRGRAGDGGPACATVPLLGSGWTVRARVPLLP